MTPKLPVRWAPYLGYACGSYTCKLTKEGTHGNAIQLSRHPHLARREPSTRSREHLLWRRRLAGRNSLPTQAHNRPTDFSHDRISVRNRASRASSCSAVSAIGWGGELAAPAGSAGVAAAATIWRPSAAFVSTNTAPSPSHENLICPPGKSLRHPTSAARLATAPANTDWLIASTTARPDSGAPSTRISARTSTHRIMQIGAAASLVSLGFIVRIPS